MKPDTQSGLDRAAIIRHLNRLSDELGANGLSGELCLFGGTAMVLGYAARVSTKDVDALFKPAQQIRDAAGRIAGEHGLDADWLNDAVKGFISERHDVTTGDLPQFEHLRLTMPVPEYLLAMKCMASRLGAGFDASHDVADIVFLCSHLQLKSAAAVLDIVARYYPPNRIPLKTQYLIDGLFEEGLL